MLSVIIRTCATGKQAVLCQHEECPEPEAADLGPLGGGRNPDLDDIDGVARGGAAKACKAARGEVGRQAFLESARVDVDEAVESQPHVRGPPFLREGCRTQWAGRSSQAHVCFAWSYTPSCELVKIPARTVVGKTAL